MDPNHANGAIAVGTGSQAVSYRATALGDYKAVSGTDSIGIGSRAQVTGDRSISAGLLSEASGVNAIAIGDKTISSSNDSVAIGEKASATSSQLFAIIQSVDANTRNIAKGMNFAVDTGTAYNAQLGDTVSIKGDGKNLSISVNKGVITVHMSDTPVFTVSNGRYDYRQYDKSW